MEREVIENPGAEIKSECQKEESCLKMLDALIETTKQEYHEIFERRSNSKQRQSKPPNQESESDSEGEQFCGGFNERKQKSRQAEMDERIRSAIRADEDIQMDKSVHENFNASSTKPCGTHNCGIGNCDTNLQAEKLYFDGNSDSSPSSENNDTTCIMKSLHVSLTTTHKSQQKTHNEFPQEQSTADQIKAPETDTRKIECGKVQIELYEKIISNLLQERQKNLEIILQLKHQLNCYEKRFQDLEKLAKVAAKYEDLTHDVSKLQKELQVFHLREQIYQSFLAKNRSDLCLYETMNVKVDGSEIVGQLSSKNQPERCVSEAFSEKCNAKKISDKNESLPDDRFASQCAQAQLEFSLHAEIGCSKMPANQVLQIVQHLQKTIIEQGNEIKNLRSTFAKMT